MYIHEEYMGQVADAIHATPWAELDRGRFADRSAAVYTAINFSHPFREGNGRAAKLFMSQLAENTNYDYDFGAIDPEVWNTQSGLSGPARGDTALHPEALTAVFEYIIVERPAPPPAPPARSVAAEAAYGQPGSPAVITPPTRAAPAAVGRRPARARDRPRTEHQITTAAIPHKTAVTTADLQSAGGQTAGSCRGGKKPTPVG